MNRGDNADSEYLSHVGYTVGTGIVEFNVPLDTVSIGHFGDLEQ